MTDLPPMVSAVTGALIAQLDRLLPGQLQALYLVGSLALHDFIPGQSDIDFIAVLDGDVDTGLLAKLHADLALAYPDIDCDGIYLRPGELAAPPQGTGIEARTGRIDPASAAERNPVCWLILADAGLTLRGPRPDEHWVAAERAAAMAYSRQNLATYWQPWLEQRRRGESLLADEAIIWACLGIARLHATIATGHVPSKTGAGEHALSAFPQHSRIITEALRLRRGPPGPSLYATLRERMMDLIAFMDAALARGLQ